MRNGNAGDAYNRTFGIRPFAQGLEFAVKTRAALLLLAAVLTAGPAYANEIICLVDAAHCRYVTYEHAFDLEAEEFEPIYLPTPYDLWSIPPFDVSLGIPEALVMDIEGTVTVSGRIHDLAGATEVDLFAVASLSSLYDPRASRHILAGFKVCTAAPCEVSFGPSPFRDIAIFNPSFSGSFGEFPWDSDPGDPLILRVPHWSFENSYFALQGDEGYVAAPITLRTSVSGIARATYIYEATELPEPSTLLLLGGGLLGAAWTRRRRRNYSRRASPQGATTSG